MVFADHLYFSTELCSKTQRAPARECILQLVCEQRWDPNLTSYRFRRSSAISRGKGNKYILRQEQFYVGGVQAACSGVQAACSGVQAACSAFQECWRLKTRWTYNTCADKVSVFSACSGVQSACSAIQECWRLKTRWTYNTCADKVSVFSACSGVQSACSAFQECWRLKTRWTYTLGRNLTTCSFLS